MLPRMMAVRSLTSDSSSRFGAGGTLVRGRSKSSLLQAMESKGPRTRSQSKGKTVYNESTHVMGLRSASKDASKVNTSIPSEVPKRQLDIDQVWNGDRKTLRWFDNVETEMGLSKSGGCQLRKPGCTVYAHGIDHKIPFSETQTEMERRTYCTGVYHYSGVPLTEARLVYNGRIESDTSGMDLTNQVAKAFQWACAPCNGNKGGVKGNDGNYPKVTGACRCDQP